MFRFRSRWSWVAPLVGAVAMFTGVLLLTPPGFGALVGVAFGSPRGPSADSAAYALGSAASLALLALLALAVVCGSIDAAAHRGR